MALERDTEEPTVVKDIKSCDNYLETVLYNGKTKYVGFDCEWSRGGKISLMQLATWDKVVLIRVNCLDYKLTDRLVQFLQDTDIKKFGVNINKDAQKIEQDFGVQLKSFVDLRCLVSRSSGFRKTVWKKIEAHEKKLSERKLFSPKLDLSKERRAWMPKLGLSTLTSDILGQTMDKDVNVRCGEWDCKKLTPAQQKYAALDANAAITIAYALTSDTLTVPDTITEDQNIMLDNMVNACLEKEFHDREDFQSLLFKIKEEHDEFVVEHYVAKTALSIEMKRRLFISQARMG